MYSVENEVFNCTPGKHIDNCARTSQNKIKHVMDFGDVVLALNKEGGAPLSVDLANVNLM